MRITGPFRVFRALVVGFIVTAFASAQSPAITPATPSIQSFQLVTAESGWLLAGNRLFWTDSVGSQWSERTPAAASSSNASSSNIDGVFFRPDGNGWLLESSESAGSGTSLAIAHTTDNGAHWTQQSIPSPFTDARAFNGKASTFFTDPQHGYLMLGVQSGSAFRLGALLRTTDGGKTWTQAPAPPVGGNITFVDATHGFAGPGPGGDELYATADAGMTWQRSALASPAALNNIPSTVTLPAFSSSTNGALIRTYATDHGPTIVNYATSNGGTTWTVTSTTQTSTPTVISLAKDGSITGRISAPAAGLSANPSVNLAPVHTSFATSSNGWVEFQSGTCSDGTCTQTDSLQGTLDGGKTYFVLGKIPGLQMEQTNTFSMPSRSNTSASPEKAHPNSTTVYNTSGVIGFDACSLPTTAQMTTWISASPYRVVGVYIGGANFACRSGLASLTQSYVSGILAQGWQMAPLWVGPQGVGSCSGSCTTFSTDPATANAQAVTEADSAVAAMSALGLGQGSTIVYDMEAYSYTNATDLAAAQSFLDGWDTELHRLGYLAAVYSSHPEFDTWIPGDVTPAIDTIWFAYFFSSGVACGTQCQTVFPTPTASFDLPTNYWLNNHRARQTSSAFEQTTYGGIQIDIDEDWFDAPMVTATPNVLTVTVSATGTGASGSVASTTITNPNSDVTAYTAISCGISCTANFAPTDTVTLVATAGANSQFSSWTGCSTTSGTTCTVTVSASKTVSAVFVAGYSLTVTKSGTGTGTVTSADNTIACGTTCSASYTVVTSETLTATPSANSTFSGWTGCTTASGSTCVVSVTGAASVTATFTGPVALTVTKAGTGTGTVASSDNSISCGTTCSASYAVGTVVTLTATPATGSTFTSWTGCTTSSSNTCSVTMAAAESVTVTFTGPAALTVTKAGTGTGTVASADNSISCGTTCSATYAVGTVVTLTATPATGSTFTSWTGCTTSSTNTCSVTMAAAENVTATFTGPVALTVTKAGTGTGTVASSDNSLSCGSTCSASYTVGTVVTLTATAATGSTFTSWAGCTSSSANTCSVTMAAAENVTATFTGPAPLTVTKVGTGTGTVASSDNSISCGSTCSASYTVGTVVTLTATPAAGSVFTSWTGCTSSSANTCSVTMATAESVTATFTATSFSAAVTPTSLTITAGQSGTASVTFTPTGNYIGTFSTFSCTGLSASVGTCTFSPTSLAATGNNAPLSTTLTITTNAATAQLVTHSNSGILAAGLLLPSLLLPWVLRRKDRAARIGKLLLIAFAVVTLGLVGAITGCGGNSSPAANTTPVFTGTIQVNYTASTNSGASQIPLQLTVNR